MLRFLHCADFHIDSPFAGESATKREEMRGRLLSAFQAVIDRIITEQIPLCLLAGDLFDTETPSSGAVQAVQAGFARASGCRFFIAPGNHDPYTADSVWAKTDFGDNVTVFDSPTLTAYSLPELDTTVYGYAFVSAELPNCPVTRAPTGEGINLLVCHADLTTAQTPYAPVSERTLSETGMDYIALGHIHDGGVPHKAGSTLYAYSGCPQGRDFGECGEKGVLLCEVSRTEGITRREARFTPTASYRFFRVSADITGCTDDASVCTVLNELIRERSFDAACAVRFTLTGNTPTAYHLSPSSVRAMLTPLAECELLDKSVPLADEATLKEDLSLRGEFYRSLSEELHSEDEQTRARAQYALKLGLCAMDGGNIDEL